MSSPQSKLPSKHIHTISTHEGPINTIAFSSSGGTYVLTGSSDRQIHLTRTEPSSSSSASASASTSLSSASPSSIPPPTARVTTTPIQAYTSHGYPVLCLDVSHDNNTFISGSGDRTGPWLWDIQQPKNTIRRFGGNTNSACHTQRITCVTFAGSGDSVVVSGSDDRSVRLWDVRSRDARPLQVWTDAKDGVSCVSTAGSKGESGGGGGSEIVVGSTDGRIRSYDVRTGQVTVDVQPGPVTSLDLTRDGRTMLVGCLDGKIRLMDRGNGACLRTVPDGRPAESTSLTASAPLSAPRVTTGSTSTSPAGGGGGGGESGYRNDSLRLQSCLAVNESLILSGSESDGDVRAWDVLSGKMVGAVSTSMSMSMSMSADVDEPTRARKKTSSSSNNNNNNNVKGKYGPSVISVVKWREGSVAAGRMGVWAAGGVDGVVRIYGS